jgi:hypothetical protein
MTFVTAPAHDIRYFRNAVRLSTMPWRGDRQGPRHGG